MLRTLIEGNKYTVIHDHDISTRAIDASYGEIDIPKLEDDEYQQFIKDINSAVNLGALIVSIYLDASGTVFAKDSNGNDIYLRTVKSTSYTYPYFDNNDIWHDGKFSFTFDGAQFSNVDTLNSLYWYYIQGVSDINNLLQWT
jgi:hypothetical protein